MDSSIRLIEVPITEPPYLLLTAFDNDNHPLFCETDPELGLTEDEYWQLIYN